MTSPSVPVIVPDGPPRRVRDPTDPTVFQLGILLRAGGGCGAVVLVVGMLMSGLAMTSIALGSLLSGHLTGSVLAVFLLVALAAQIGILLGGAGLSATIAHGAVSRWRHSTGEGRWLVLGPGTVHRRLDGRTHAVRAVRLQGEAGRSLRIDLDTTEGWVRLCRRDLLIHSAQRAIEVIDLARGLAEGCERPLLDERDGESWSRWLDDAVYRAEVALRYRVEENVLEQPEYHALEPQDRELVHELDGWRLNGQVWLDRDQVRLGDRLVTLDRLGTAAVVADIHTTTIGTVVVHFTVATLLVRIDDQVHEVEVGTGEEDFRRALWIAADLERRTKLLSVMESATGSVEDVPAEMRRIGVLRAN